MLFGIIFSLFDMFLFPAFVFLSCNFTSLILMWYTIWFVMEMCFYSYHSECFLIFLTLLFEWAGNAVLILRTKQNWCLKEMDTFQGRQLCQTLFASLIGREAERLLSFLQAVVRPCLFLSYYRVDPFSKGAWCVQMVTQCHLPIWKWCGKTCFVYQFHLK